MKFKITERPNPTNPNEKIYYPAPVFCGKVDEDELLERVSFSSSVNQSDVRAVVWNLFQILPEYLAKGNSVRIDPLGTFRLSIRATSSKNKEDVSAENITGAHVVFRPSSKLSGRIANLVKFNRE